MSTGEQRSLEEENTALKSALAKAEAEIQDKQHTIDKQQTTLDLILRALGVSPVILWTMDVDGNTTFSAGKGMELMGIKPGDITPNAFEAYRGTPIERALRSALAGNEVTTCTEPIPGISFDNWMMPLRDPHTNAVTGAVGLSIHASARVKVERELRDKIDLIGKQSETIRALATPIINVWEEVLVLPVIGIVDSQRTADMMDSLLAAIMREKSRFAIVDLTGVEVVDTSTADHIIKLFKAAKVLGVDGVLCGIRPAVAQTVIALGVELGTVRTMRTLQDALRWCMAVREKRLATKTKALVEVTE